MGGQFMSMHVVGVGVGRTGTYSLKLAINRLGLGPCHHMEEVLHNMSVQVPLWSAALQGKPNWPAIYNGFTSTVDWPTAAFYRELLKEYPSARFILTRRSPETWAASFGSTIYKLIAGKDQAPPDMKDWLAMAESVIAYTGFPGGLSNDDLMQAFVAHNEAVEAAIPASQLLVFEVKDGWESLCKFLGAQVPDEPFPRTNDREEFWDLVSGNA
jgi:Sulfotransferase domain